MTRLLSNAEIEEHLGLTEYLEAAEETYRELGEGRAASTPRQTVVSHAADPPDGATEPAFHVMRTMGGSVGSFGVSAMRVNSDVKHWPERHGTVVQERIPLDGDRYNGLVFLFDTNTGELLAIFPDGLVQTYHVAGGIAIGAKYLAPAESRTLGLFGTGHQARTHLPALDAVLDLERVNVYSPTEDHRTEFAAEMDDRIDASVRPVDSPRAACENADVINCATNSTDAVFEAEWIEPGTHIGFIGPDEIPDDLWRSDRIDRLTISTTNQRVLESSVGSGYVTASDRAADPWRWFVRPADPPYRKTEVRPDGPRPIDDTEILRLPELVVDSSLGRSRASDVTAFAQRGDGVMFAAIGHVLYELAAEHDLGRTLESDLLTQRYVP